MQSTVEKTITKEDYLTGRLERTSYGSFFLGQNILFWLVSSYLMLFYTDVVGIPAAAAGTIFLIARVWDAVNDPIMGIIIERSKFKSGKFLPWIKISSVILPFITFALFLNPGQSVQLKIGYAFCTYIIWGMVYTMTDAPISALATVITDNIDERVKIISLGRIGANIGSIFGSAAIMSIVTRLGWTQGALALCILGAITMIPISRIAVERTIDRSKENKATFKDMKKCIVENKPLMVSLIVSVLVLFTNTSFTMMSYIGIYNFGNPELIGVIALLMNLPGVFLPIIVMPLIKKFGKKAVYMGGLVIYISLSIIMYLVGYQNIMLAFVLTFLRGFVGMIGVLFAYMLNSDAIDYGEYTTGERAEGMVFSISGFAGKLNMAIGGAIGGWALTFINYTPNVAQTPETLNGLWFFFTAFPAIGAFAAFIVLGLFYKLSDKELAEMIKVNRSRKNNK